MENKDNRYIYVVLAVVVILLVLYFIFLRGGDNPRDINTNEADDVSETTAPSEDDGLSDEERTRIINETTAPKASALDAVSSIRLNEETSAPSN